MASVLTKKLELPIKAIYDCDPRGIECFVTLKFGSRSQVGTPDSFCIPDLVWLGVLPEELKEIDSSKMLHLTQVAIIRK